MEVMPCKHCRNPDGFTIQLLYSGWRQRLFIVECSYCHNEIIPVVVGTYIPQQEIYSACEQAWNGVNAMNSKFIFVGYNDGDPFYRCQVCKVVVGGDVERCGCEDDEGC